MTIRTIKLKYNLDKSVDFERLFDDFFTEDRSSPELALFIALHSDAWLQFGQSPKDYPHHYNIYEIDESDGLLLASIKITPYPSSFLVSIDEVVNDSQDILSQSDDWEKVKRVVLEIVKRAELMDFALIWTDPPEFMSKDQINNQKVSHNSMKISKWKRVWYHIKPWRARGDSLEKISAALKKDDVYKYLPNDRNTVSKIVKAGLAGELEDQKVQQKV